MPPNTFSHNDELFESRLDDLTRRAERLEREAGWRNPPMSRLSELRGEIPSTNLNDLRAINDPLHRSQRAGAFRFTNPLEATLDLPDRGQVPLGSLLDEIRQRRGAHNFSYQLTDDRLGNPIVRITEQVPRRNDPSRRIPYTFDLMYESRTGAWFEGSVGSAKRLIMGSIDAAITSEGEIIPGQIRSAHENLWNRLQNLGGSPFVVPGQGRWFENVTLDNLSPARLRTLSTAIGVPEKLAGKDISHEQAMTLADEVALKRGRRYVHRDGSTLIDEQYIANVPRDAEGRYLTQKVKDIQRWNRDHWGSTITSELGLGRGRMTASAYIEGQYGPYEGTRTRYAFVESPLPFSEGGALVPERRLLTQRTQSMVIPAKALDELKIGDVFDASNRNVLSELTGFNLNPGEIARISDLYREPGTTGMMDLHIGGLYSQSEHKPSPGLKAQGQSISPRARILRAFRNDPDIVYQIPQKPDRFADFALQAWMSQNARSVHDQFVLAHAGDATSVEEANRLMMEAMGMLSAGEGGAIQIANAGLETALNAALSFYEENAEIRHFSNVPILPNRAEYMLESIGLDRKAWQELSREQRDEYIALLTEKYGVTGLKATRGGQWRVSYFARVLEAEMPSNPIFKTKGGKKNLSAQDLQILRRLQPDFYRELLDRAAAGEFQNQALEHMLAVTANGDAELTKMLKPKEVSEIMSPEDFAEFHGDLIRKYENPTTGRIEDPASYQREILEKIADYHEGFLSIDGHVLMPARTAAGTIRSGTRNSLGTSLADTIVKEMSHQLQASIGKDTEEAKSARAKYILDVINAQANLEDSPSTRKKGMGLSVSVLGGPSQAAPLPDDVLVANDSDIRRQIYRMKHLTKEEKRDLYRSALKHGIGGLLWMQTSNEDMSYRAYRVFPKSLADKLFDGIEDYNVSPGGFLMPETGAEGEGKDYDTDPSALMLTALPLGNLDFSRTTRERIIANPAREMQGMWKKLDDLQRGLYGKIGKLLSGRDIQSLMMPARDVMEALAQMGTSKGSIGKVYDPFIIHPNAVAGQMSEWAGLSEEASKALAFATSQFGHGVYQLAMDMEASESAASDLFTQVMRGGRMKKGVLNLAGHEIRSAERFSSLMFGLAAKLEQNTRDTDIEANRELYIGDARNPGSILNHAMMLMRVQDIEKPEIVERVRAALEANFEAGAGTNTEFESSEGKMRLLSAILGRDLKDKEESLIEVTKLMTGKGAESIGEMSLMGALITGAIAANSRGVNIFEDSPFAKQLAGLHRVTSNVRKASKGELTYEGALTTGDMIRNLGLSERIFGAFSDVALRLRGIGYSRGISRIQEGLEETLNLPEFHFGGRVFPEDPGQEHLARVLGGEYVLNAQQVNDIRVGLGDQVIEQVQSEIDAPGSITSILLPGMEGVPRGAPPRGRRGKARNAQQTRRGNTVNPFPSPSTTGDDINFPFMPDGGWPDVINKVADDQGFVLVNEIRAANGGAVQQFEVQRRFTSAEAADAYMRRINAFQMGHVDEALQYLQLNQQQHLEDLALINQARLGEVQITPENLSEFQQAAFRLKRIGAAVGEVKNTLGAQALPEAYNRETISDAGVLAQFMETIGLSGQSPIQAMKADARASERAQRDLVRQASKLDATPKDVARSEVFSDAIRNFEDMATVLRRVNEGSETYTKIAKEIVNIYDQAEKQYSRAAGQRSLLGEGVSDANRRILEAFETEVDGVSVADIMREQKSAVDELRKTLIGSEVKRATSSPYAGLEGDELRAVQTQLIYGGGGKIGRARLQEAIRAGLFDEGFNVAGFHIGKENIELAGGLLRGIRRLQDPSSIWAFRAAESFAFRPLLRSMSEYERVEAERALMSARLGGGFEGISEGIGGAMLRRGQNMAEGSLLLSQAAYNAYSPLLNIFMGREAASSPLGTLAAIGVPALGAGVVGANILSAFGFPTIAGLPAALPIAAVTAAAATLGTAVSNMNNVYALGSDLDLFSNFAGVMGTAAHGAKQIGAVLTGNPEAYFQSRDELATYRTIVDSLRVGRSPNEVREIFPDASPAVIHGVDFEVFKEEAREAGIDYLGENAEQIYGSVFGQLSRFGNRHAFTNQQMTSAFNMALLGIDTNRLAQTYALAENININAAPPEVAQQFQIQALNAFTAASLSGQNLDVWGDNEQQAAAFAANINLNRRLNDSGPNISIDEALELIKTPSVMQAFAEVDQMMNRVSSSETYGRTGFLREEIIQQAAKTPGLEALARRWGEQYGISVQQADIWTMMGIDPVVADSLVGRLTLLGPQEFAQAQGVLSGDQRLISAIMPNDRRALLDPVTGMSRFYNRIDRREFEMLLSTQADWFSGVSYEDIAGGERDIRAQIRDIQMEETLLGYRHQNALRRGSFALYTGGGRMRSDGTFAPGDLAAELAAAFREVGFEFNAGNGMGYFQIEDRQRQIQREQQMFSLQQSGQNLALAQAEFDLRGRHFYERFGLQQEQFAYNTAFQRQQMAIDREMQVTQRGWQQEDIAMQRAQSEIHFAWQMEDFDREIRYARGMQKRNLMRQQQRAVIDFGMQMTQQERTEERFEQRIKWEDQEFERKRQHFEQTVQFQQREMEMQRRHFEEGRQLDQQRLAMQQQSHQRNMQWMQEEWALEDQRRLLDRQFYMIQQQSAETLAVASQNASLQITGLNNALIGVSNYAAEVNGELNVMAGILNLLTDLLDGKTGGTASGGGSSSGSGGFTYVPGQGDWTSMPGSVIGLPPVSGWQPDTWLPPGSSPVITQFRDGGYTGDSLGDGPVGVVHPREYVVPERGALVVRGENPDERKFWQTVIQLLQKIAENPTTFQAIINGSPTPLQEINPRRAASARLP